MACNSNTLVQIDARCDGSIGGIKSLYIAPKDAVVINTTNLTADDEIPQTGVTLASDSTAVFVQYQFRKNTGAYTSTMESDATIGNHSVTTEVTLQFSRAEAHKRMAIQSAINSGSVVIVEDMYGRYLILGEDNTVEVTNAVMQSGTANTDLSGFTLTLQDVSNELPHFLVEGFDITALTTRA